MAVIESVPHVTNIWALRTSFDAECVSSLTFVVGTPANSLHRHDSSLLISTIYDTRLFLFHNGSGKMQMEECDGNQLPALIRNVPTIAAGVAKEGGGLVQITKNAVIVVDMLSGMELSRWSQGEITVATVNPTQICVALKGGTLVYLSYREARGLVPHKFVCYSCKSPPLFIPFHTG